jgi:hypothetical protein
MLPFLSTSRSRSSAPITGRRIVLAEETRAYRWAACSLPRATTGATTGSAPIVTLSKRKPASRKDKNSKRSYGAALMKTTLLMNERPGRNSCSSRPPSRWRTSPSTKDPDGFLQKRMHIQEHLRKITDKRTKATLEIKAFDTSVLTAISRRACCSTSCTRSPRTQLPNA